MIGAPIGVIGIGEPLETTGGGQGNIARGGTRRPGRDWKEGNWRRGVYRYPEWAERG